jgi:hypothetical protein
MKEHCIWKRDEYRIIEVRDEDYSLKDLKGDCYCPKTNDDIDPETLAKEEKEFEERIECYGVYGYCLQKWNYAIDRGWETQDSCWGFVGRYDEYDNDHYIVSEYMGKVING